MPEEKPPIIEESDFYEPAEPISGSGSSDFSSIVHSASTPDKVTIGGENVKIIDEETKEELEENLWTKFEGIVKKADTKIVEVTGKEVNLFDKITATPKSEEQREEETLAFWTKVDSALTNATDKISNYLPGKKRNKIEEELF